MAVFIKVLIYLVIAGISFLFFRTIHAFFQNLSNMGDQFEATINQRLKERKEFTAQKRYLSKLGIMYRLKDYNLSPSKYIILRVFCAVFFGFAAYLLIGKHFGVIGASSIAGYFLCDLYFRHKNKEDNKALLNDIFNIYLTLKIQLSSNIYIINSLLSAKDIIASKRLKEALDELITNLSDKTISYSDSVKQFKDRFDSEEINNLCAFLLSYISYGVSEKYLKDVMSEVNEIATEAAMQQEHKIETKVGMVAFLYFVSILTIVIYCVIQSFGNINLFV